MSEQVTSGDRPIFETQVIELVEMNMTVVDVAGERLGHVSYIHMGDPEADTTEGEDYQTPGILRWVWRGIVGSEPKTPEPFRSRLLRHGFIKINTPGRTAHDLYASADFVQAVAGETVTLSVATDQLPEVG